MKSVVKIITSVLLLQLCFHLQQGNSQTDKNYWAENVAFLDMRTRTVDNGSYVREIVVVDFKKSEKLIENFGLEEDLFSDNGQGFDARAGDGIYTSKKSYPHTEKVPFESVGRVKSAVNKIITNNRFNYKEQLYSIIGIPSEDASIKIGIPTVKVHLECDAERCDCPSQCLCIACDMGWTSWCIDWKNCKIDVDVLW